MALRTTIDQKVGNVDRFIPTAYDNVKIVADNIAKVIQVSDWITNGNIQLAIDAVALVDADRIAAEAAAAAAAADAAATALAYDTFDDRFLGAFATEPTLDNDGDPLLEGALYFDSVLDEMFVYTGSVWVQISGGGGGAWQLDGDNSYYWVNGGVGNIGIGINTGQFEAWNSSYTALQVGIHFSVMASQSLASDAYINHNAFHDGVSWKYQDTDEAQQIQFAANGSIILSTSASGTAETAITWFNNLVLDSGGHTIFPAVSDAVTPTIGFGAGGYGFYSPAINQIYYSINGAAYGYFGNGWIISGTGSDSGAIKSGAATAINPTLIPSSTDSNTGVGWASADNLSFITGGVEAIRIDANQHIGVGVVPASWREPATDISIDLGSYMSLYSDTALTSDIGNNVYLGASGYQRRNAAAATRYQQYLGAHTFDVAASGAADSVISWVNGITIDNSGQVKLTSGVLKINELAAAVADEANWGQVWVRNDANQTLMFTDDAGVDHEVAGTDVIGGQWLPITGGIHYSSGDVSIGKSTIENWDAAYSALQIGGIGAVWALTAESAGSLAAISNNVYWTGTQYSYTIADEASLYYQQNGQHIFQVAAAGAADAAISWTSALQILNDGQIKLITGYATSNWPMLAFGDGDSGFTEHQDDSIVVLLAGNGQWQWLTDGDFQAIGISNAPLIRHTSSGSTIPVFCPSNADNNTGVGWGSAADNLSLITGGVEAIRINDSQKVGITATPINDFTTIASALQIGESAVFTGKTTGTGGWVDIMQNTYYSVTGFVHRYINTDVVSKYTAGYGGHYWYVAPSGTAGATVTLTEAMRINTHSGGYGVVINPLSYGTNPQLQIYNSSYGWYVEDLTGGNYQLVHAAAQKQKFLVSGIPTLTLTNQKVGIGQTEANANWGNNYDVLDMDNGGLFSYISVWLGQNVYHNNVNFLYKTTAAASYVQLSSSGNISFHLAPSGTVDTTASFTTAGTFTLTGTSPQLVLPQVNDATNPTLAFENCGFYEDTSQDLCVSVGGNKIFDFTSNSIEGNNAGMFYIAATQGASTTVPIYTFVGDTNTGFTRPGADLLSVITAGVERVRWNDGGMFIKQIGVSVADIADFGQIWVRDNGAPTPQSLMFTNDDGTDFVIGGEGAGTSPWVASGNDIYYTTGNIAVGTSDFETWDTDFSVLYMGTLSFFYADDSAGVEGTGMAANAYKDAANWKYRETAAASHYLQQLGGHYFQVASSGTIDTTISWINALILQSDGDTQVMQDLILSNQSLGAAGAVGTPTYSFSTGTTSGMYLGASTSIRFARSGVDKFIIGASGAGIFSAPKSWSTLGNDYYSLNVTDGMQLWGREASANVGGLAQNAYYNGNWKYILAGQAFNYEPYQTTSKSHRFTYAVSGTAEGIVTWVEALLFDQSTTRWIFGDATNKGMDVTIYGEELWINNSGNAVDTGITVQNSVDSWKVEVLSTGEFSIHDGTNEYISADATHNAVGLGIDATALKTWSGAAGAGTQMVGNIAIGYGASSPYIARNAYYNSGWLRQSAGWASAIDMSTSRFSFLWGSSSTADSAITWVNLLDMDVNNRFWFNCETAEQLSWWTGVTALQTGPAGGISSFSNRTEIWQNSYYNNSQLDKYINTAAASRISMDVGKIYLQVAPSGTAGNTITWSDGLQIDNSANVRVESGSLMINEVASAATDVANYGQLWVLNNTPNELYFTDDAGTDFKVSMGFQVQSPTTTTSGTSHDYTIPSWATVVHIMLSEVSISGTAYVQIQLGDAGGIETTGYTGGSSNIATSVGTSLHTAGFKAYLSGASRQFCGHLTLSLIDSANNTWVISGSIGDSQAAAMAVINGQKSLTQALSTVRLTTSNGTDTFDSGTFNVSYA